MMTAGRWMIASAALLPALPAHAGFVGLEAEAYLLPSSTGGQWSTVDLYARFDAPSDTVVSVFNAHLFSSDGSSFYQGPLPFLESFAPYSNIVPAWGVDWAADSFVTIGADQSTDNFTELTGAVDSGFGVIGPAAGWFDGSFGLGQGVAGDDQRVLLGRFTWNGVPTRPVSLEVATIGITFVNGLQWSTATGSGSFAYVPAPSAAALLAGAHWLRRRDRRGA